VRAAYAEGREVATTVVAVGFVIALLGVGGVMLFAGRLAAPLRALAADADRIGRDAAATMLPRERGSRELLQLSTALRSLLLRLARDPVSGAVEGTAEPDGGVQLATGIDPLTGLMRRDTFMIHAADAMRYYQRYGRSIATLVVDIDRFRRTNETYGRAAGDAVIRRVSELIEQTVRSTDKVARMGGDEFVVLLREIDEQQTYALAERLRKKIESAAIIHGNNAIGAVANIGAAVVSRQDRDVEDLIERADLALYWAKSAGRNCVRLAPTMQQPVGRAA
jgi:diguanylate cyclase (GGDEF)-like protein